MRPQPWLALAALTVGVTYGVLRGKALLPLVLEDSVSTSIGVLFAVQWLVETLFAFGLAGTTLLSLSYLLARRSHQPASGPDQSPLDDASPSPRVAVVYLCCGDLDPKALSSLRRLRHDGPIELVLHDDQPGGDPAVEEFVAGCHGDSGLSVRVLRRSDKAGSKAGAVNYVLDRVADEFDFFFLADNDSTALERDSLRALLQPMRDPQVAVAQARNVRLVGDDYSTVNRICSAAVEVFHLFLSAGSRHAWMPFVGHNALLRMRAVREVGGLLPGCFADDIDLTLRLNTQGHRVVYCPDVRFGEHHPPSYAAFRKRSYKWACGSSQVLRNWLLPVLQNRHMSLAEKWGFIQFLGFYALQALVLFYTAVAFLIAPVLLERDQFQHLSVVVAGTVLPLLVFLPVLAYAARARWRAGLPAFLVICWLVYGATDFPTTRGVLHGLRRRMRPWVPTNSIRGGADRSLCWEMAFGAAVLLVPLCYLPELLLSPLTFLVAGKFLAIPTMAELYQDGVRPAAAPQKLIPRLTRLLTPLLAVVLLTSIAAAQGTDEPSTLARPRVVGSELLVAGEPYTVRGIHYGPWRPGTGPGRSDYPPQEHIAEDMAMIAATHANTIFVFDAPRYLLDVAWKHDIRVLYGFWLQWPQYGSEAFATQEQSALVLCRAVVDHPAVLGWVLGNEIPAWLVAEHGAGKVAASLRDLRTAVREIDPVRPVTHANWPLTRSLDLDFLDIAAFNLYALWPPEVVAMGYGSYVRDVLRPIAAGRPLLITEYGANSIEAGLEGQARLARECWQQLRAGGAIGGFAFEFADEWWKNYSNPKVAGAWWDRADDFDDHLRLDEDPEESYGLVTGERRLKPAYAAVAEIYAAEASGRASTGSLPPAIAGPLFTPGRLVALTLGLALLAFVLARWLRTREARIQPRPHP